MTTFHWWNRLACGAVHDPHTVGLPEEVGSQGAGDTEIGWRAMPADQAELFAQASDVAREDVRIQLHGPGTAPWLVRWCTTDLAWT